MLPHAWGYFKCLFRFTSFRDESRRPQLLCWTPALSPTGGICFKQTATAQTLAPARGGQEGMGKWETEQVSTLLQNTMSSGFKEKKKERKWNIIYCRAAFCLAKSCQLRALTQRGKARGCLASRPALQMEPQAAKHGAEPEQSEKSGTPSPAQCRQSSHCFPVHSRFQRLWRLLFPGIPHHRQLLHTAAWSPPPASSRMARALGVCSPLSSAPAPSCSPSRDTGYLSPPPKRKKRQGCWTSFSHQAHPGELV